MEKVLSRCLVPADQMIKNLVEIELSYINTNHPDFVGGTNTLMGMVQNNEDMPKNEDLAALERRSERSSGGQERKQPQDNYKNAQIKE